ncbi:membrane protein YfhO [Reichenbachiella agariperforans]|uniref:Membrane protein YfhO n=1 Tax=Reichenbachiella agariperforans TaxID=156994 RepID=A0A1M6T2P1_REIAG|nr:YfhO family protein [Reichenbachiella agariperforans]SHK51136.1 membrane protein YfhO [Reichenbachiella agariperforans]
MKKFDLKKDILPHLIAVLVFLIVTVVFYAPVFFDNKELPQHDITQWEGSAQELTSFRDQTGEEGLWTNSMFGGMPGYLINVEFSGELTKDIHQVLSLFLPHPTGIILIAFLSCYIMLLVLGVRPWIAIAGALAFGLTSFNIISIGAGHNSKVSAVAYMPLVIAGVYAAFHQKRLMGFVLTALGLALQLRVNHLQITYYLMLMVLVFGLFQLIQSVKEKTLPEFAKTVGLLLVAVLMAVGANFGRLWTIMEYSPYSMRGKSELTVDGVNEKSGLEKDYAFQYSNGILEPLVLFIPNFFGGTAQEDLGKNSNLEQALKKQGASRQQIQQSVQAAPAYWGDQPLTAPYYAGAIVVFLFVLSLLVLDRKYTRWVEVLVILSIVLSWGDNFETFNYLVFDYLPGYNKFRSVTFVIIIAILTMVLSGFMGLEKVLSEEWDQAMQKKFILSVAIAGGFALLAALLAGMGSYRGAIDERLASYPAWYLEALRADRASLLRVDAFRTLFFVIAAAAVIWLSQKQKLSKGLAYGLIITLVLIDMFGVAKRYLNGDSFARKAGKGEWAMSEADKRILQDSDPDYRVLNLMNPFNDAKTSYYHKSIGGYHGAKMRRYQDLVETSLSPELSQVIQDLQAGKFNFEQAQVLNMLNTKYFKAGEEARAVIPNPAANGNAWFVKEVVEVNNADDELMTMMSLDTKTEAVVDMAKFELGTIAYDSAAQVTLTAYAPNRLVYQSSSRADGLAVFSEIYYPIGWSATIDGEAVSILRANYVLRALEVPAGTHEIIFEFKPESYYTGNTITWIFNVLLVLGCLAFVGVSFREEK